MWLSWRWGWRRRPASATPLILNGSFEAGLAGWTRVDQVGSDGTFFLQTGTTSPVNGDPVPAPTDGISAAMTDAQGPGTHVLYQDFVVPVGTLSGFLAFDVFVGNRADAFATPNTLDFSTPALNQRARVDIMSVPSIRSPSGRACCEHLPDGGRQSRWSRGTTA